MNLLRMIPSAALFLSIQVMPNYSMDAHGELLRMDFNDTTHLTAQPAPLPSGTLVADASASRSFPGSLDMGIKGYVKVPGFKGPAGPFSVEARFRLNEYAPVSTRYISDILNTATWDNGPTQGFVLRIGGGYLYAPAPRESYASDADYQADIGWYDNTERASISKCIGEFGIARKDDNRNWKEVVTDRCIQRDTWIHMVGTWDGTDMHLYLNGQNALDTLRVLGRNARPNIDSVATAFVGARAAGSFDSRHFNGIIDFVRVVDSAMGEAEVRARYRMTYEATEDTVCHGTIVPEYPNPGQAVTAETRFRFRVEPDGACAQPGYHPELLPGDSVEVEVAGDSEFKKILCRVTSGETSFRIEGKDVVTLEDYKGAAYWRARIVRRAKAPALAKTAAASPLSDWSLARPFMFDLKRANALGIHPRPDSRSRVLAIGGSLLSVPARGGMAPVLWSLDGSRFDLAWTREGDRWLARLPAGRESRLLIQGWR